MAQDLRAYAHRRSRALLQQERRAARGLHARGRLGEGQGQGSGQEGVALANLQNLEVFAGEDRTLPLAARNASNAPVNLTGGTVTWYVGRGPRWPYSPYPVITKT